VSLVPFGVIGDAARVDRDLRYGGEVPLAIGTETAICVLVCQGLVAFMVRWSLRARWRLGLRMVREGCGLCPGLVVAVASRPVIVVCGSGVCAAARRDRKR